MTLEAYSIRVVRSVGLPLMPEDDTGLSLFGEAQGDTSLRVVHFRRNLLKPQFFYVPRGCGPNVQNPNVEESAMLSRDMVWIKAVQ